MIDKQALYSLRDALIKAQRLEGRAAELAKSVALSPFYTVGKELAKEIERLSLVDQAICHAVIACGQTAVFEQIFTHPKILERLREVEIFYAPAGGIIGYQCLSLELIEKKEHAFGPPDLHQPIGFDIRSPKERVVAAGFGLDALEHLAFLCPVGGAGDRFGLADPKTKEPWPLARLEFLGRSLLERLVLDIVALEKLFFERFSRRIEIPVGLMVSEEKDNEAHVREILTESNYFGRSKTSFFLFKQPLVPLFDAKGNWVCGDEGLEFKPGGHGMIWRAAKLAGFFEYIAKMGKQHLLIRQINNPLAGIDDGLLAFLGVAVSHQKQFGFASCPRHVGAKEGMNVVRRDGMSYALTNIEYTDFARYGLEDTPSEPGGECSIFPSNTNILFATLKAIEKGLERLPLPGPVINFKEGDTARVELMMQNIADSLGETFSHPLRDDELQRLETCLTYNERRRTISVTKEQWDPSRGKIDETPVGALFDWLCMMQELLDSCGIETPPLDKNIFEFKVPFLFDYHPSFGPLFSTIARRLRKGRLSEGSALILDVVDADISNISLSGVCRISAPEGRCQLTNVTIENPARVLPGDPIAASRAQLPEGLTLIIEPGGTFIAENVHIEGVQTIHVRSGEKLIYKN